MDQTMVEATERGAQIKSPEQVQREQGLRSVINNRVLAHPPPDIDLSSSFIELNPRERADLLYEKIMAYTVTTGLIRQEKKGNPDVEPEPIDPYLIAEINTLWKDPKTQETFVSRFAEARVDAKIERLSGLGKNWKAINEAIETTSQAFEQETRRVFLQQVTRPDQESATKGRIERLAQQLIKLRKDKERIVKLEGLDHTPENTDIAASIMYETLGMYYDQAQQGFVWLPSRQEIHQQTVEGLQNGRWPALRGEAGTGKSEQADAAAVALTGEQPTHLACGPNTGYKEMIADKEIDPTSGGSYEDYKPAMQAATGYEDSRELRPRFHTGRIVRFDESGRLGPKGYTDIKELRQKKPASRIDLARFERGDSVDPDRMLHDKPVLPGFAAILTTNPAGARYPDRSEPDAALRRELSYIPVDYPTMTVKNPELYEFMLATLMNSNKHIPVAEKELAPAYDRNDYSTPRKLGDKVVIGEDVLIEDSTKREHGSLYRLSFAIRALQDAYNLGNSTEIPESVLRYSIDSDEKIEIRDSGEPLTLSSSTITLGELSSWMTGFHQRRLKDDPNYQVRTLTEWIQLKLTNYLNQADEIDRAKIKALFEYYHLFDGPPDLRDAKPMTPKEIGYLSPRVPRPLHLVTAPVVEGEDLPDFVRERNLNTDIRCMLEDETSVLAKPESFVLALSAEKQIQVKACTRFTLEGTRFQYVGVDSTGNIVARIDNGRVDEAIHRLINLEDLRNNGEFTVMNFEALERLFGEDFLGPEQIEQALGFEVDPGSIPEIPFDQAELERAKELGQYLILRVDRDAAGTPLTMKHLVGKLQPIFLANSKGDILYNVDWYPDEPFYKTTTPRFKWALGSKTPVPNSTNVNYLKQTEAIAEYLKNTVFRGQTIPLEYREAFVELDSQKRVIAGFIDPSSSTYATTWKDGADRLAKLKITQLTRQIPVEVIYDFLVYFRNTDDKRLLENLYAWTGEQTHDGDLVYVGLSDSDGAHVHRWRPDYSAPDISAFLSR